MPSIELFHRKTLLGGDDLQVACLFTMFLRVIQMSCLLLPLWFHIIDESSQEGNLWEYIWYDANSQGDGECRTSHLFPLLLFIYCLSSSVIVILSFIWEFRIYTTSWLGSPTETQPRSRKIQALLEFKLIPIGIIQFLILGVAIAAACFARQHYHCRKLSQMVAYHTTAAQTSASDDALFWNDLTAWMEDDDPQETASLALHPHLFWIAFVLLWLTQLFEVVFVFLTCISLLYSSQSSTMIIPEPPNHELVEQMWQERCTKFCECLGMSTCFVFGGKHVSLGNYGDIARALTDYFETGGELDLVPSDIVMGLLILQKLQRTRILRARHHVSREVSRENSLAAAMPGQSSRLLLPSGGASDQNVEITTPAIQLPSSRLLSENGNNQQSGGSLGMRREHSFYVMHQEGSRTFYESTERKILSRNRNVDRDILAEGARFARYQLAIYTWLIYVYQYPVTGVPRMLSKSGCGCCRQRRNSPDIEYFISDCHQGRLIGDSWCQIHKSALMLQAGLTDDSDLIYVQLKSSFSDIPYCIILDHAWKTVVLAIRGTFSLEDCVTDVLVEPESLEALGDEFGFNGRDQYCHGGVAMCARIVHRDLQRHGILEKLLLGDGAKYRDYTLRVLGHSLGAGTATLISYMLRSKFPNLRCLNYSPPGATMTWDLANGCHDWCSTFVLDSDLVPRLSIHAMEHLRDEVLELIGRVKVNKAEVMRSFVQRGFLNSCRDGNLEEDGGILEEILERILSPDVQNDSPYQRQLQRFRMAQEERRSHRGLVRSTMLYPPGRVVHFMKTGEERSCMHGIAKCVTCCTTNAGSTYSPIYVKNDDLNE